MSIQSLYVSVIVFHNSKILLQQRSDFFDWELPGGHIESNEDWQQAATREVKEETNCDVRNITLFCKYEWPQLNRLTYVCKASAANSQLKAGKETLRVKWFSFPVSTFRPWPINYMSRLYLQDYQRNLELDKKIVYLPGLLGALWRTFEKN